MSSVKKETESSLLEIIVKCYYQVIMILDILVACLDVTLFRFGTF